jgi:beta-galactosidase
MTSSAQLGVCYYPEHWPESRWETDARLMIEAGIKWVRIGEFAWNRLEPSPGQFEWTWLDKAIQILGEAGLKVVLGTPSATPPYWMLSRFPDMLAVTREGSPRKFGSRRHYSFSHVDYRKAAADMAGAMAERYGRNPHIHAWQVDNEYGCHDTTLSYDRSALMNFRIWLKEKYETIDALNEAWGNVFWSMDYPNFEAVDLPNLTVTEANPAHEMDFRRFASDEVVVWNQAQIKALRQYSELPIIHNYMGRILEFDHFALGQDLEIASWDSYPLGFLEDRSDQDETFKAAYSRQGDPDFQAFHHDLYRAVGKGRWWIMEQQPGPVNWAPFNPAPLPGMVKLWTWEAIAHGAEVVSYFRWRQAPFAQEQSHAGLLSTDAHSMPVMEEVKSVASALGSIDSNSVRSDIAIVFDYSSQWAWEIQPQGQSFDYFRLVYGLYSQLRRRGYGVDIVPSKVKELGDYSHIFIPGLFAWNSSLRDAVRHANGKIIIGPRSGSKTENFSIPDELPPHLPEMDIQIRAVESLRAGALIPLEAIGAAHHWREYTETSEDIILKFADKNPALIGKDNYYYSTAWWDEEGYQTLFEQLDLTQAKLPNGLRYQDFGSYRLYLNYGAQVETFEIEQTQYDIGVAGIRVFEKRDGEYHLMPL